MAFRDFLPGEGQGHQGSVVESLIPNGPNISKMGENIIP